MSWCARGKNMEDSEMLRKIHSVTWSTGLPKV